MDSGARDRRLYSASFAAAALRASPVPDEERTTFRYDAFSHGENGRTQPQADRCLDRFPPISSRMAAAAVMATVALVSLTYWMGQPRVYEGETIRTGPHHLVFDPAPNGSIPHDMSCGWGWQERYKQLHARILAGEAPQRYAIAVGKGGLADMLLGGVSTFYFAILTDRAIQWQFKDLGARIENGYATPNVDLILSRAFHLPGEEGGVINDTQWGFLDPNCDMNAACVATVNIVGRTFKHGDLRELFSEVGKIAFAANWGLSVQLASNRHHEEQLKKMGLTAENMYRCAVEYLLEPLPEIMAAWTPEFNRMADPAHLKIAIQIRTGDQAMGEPDTEVDFGRYAAFFDCAQQIEDSNRVGTFYTAVTWFLVSDSLSLRRQAQERYGEKLLVRHKDLTLEHVLFAPNDHKGPAFAAAAAENWLIGQADFHVISLQSGFGRSGARRSANNWRSIFTLDAAGNPVEPRSCRPHDHDRLVEVADAWSGA